MVSDEARFETAAPAALVSARDRTEAAHVLGRGFPGLVFDLPSPPERFALRHGEVGGPRLRVGELILTGVARAAGELSGGAIVVGEVLGGRLHAEYGGSAAEMRAPFLRRSGAARLVLRDTHLRTTSIAADAFRAAALRYDAIGRPTRLDPGAVPTPHAAAAWAWTAAQVHRTLRDPTAADNPIVQGELFDLVIRAVLACFARPEADSGSASPWALRRAVAYLEEHATEAVAVAEVAAAARTSVRSLQLLFRRHLGATPVEHLHAIRLDAARRELLAADGVGTVHAVAERWGFGNSGRFALLYHRRFGERPSETLRDRATSMRHARAR